MNIRPYLHTLVAILTLPTAAIPQLRDSVATRLPNDRLTVAAVSRLAGDCAPRVHKDTILAIVSQESAFHPYALSINYPKNEAHRLGYQEGQYMLTRQPSTREEAYAWTRWLIHHGHSVSIGLMQVSSEEAMRLHITDLRALYDPCVNLAAGSLLLQKAYKPGTDRLRSLTDAFALYNAGSLQRGYDNGYADGVVSKAPPLSARP